jgi:hypothetical protein
MHFSFHVAVTLATIASLGTSPAEAGEPTARELVEHTIATVGEKRDLHTLRFVQSSAQIVSHDTVENDHLGPPYILLGATQAFVTDDLRGSRRLIVEASLPGPDFKPLRITRSLYTHDRLRSESTVDGKVSATPTMPATPSWETHDPIRALLLAEQAKDLQREPDVTMHEAIQHVLSFRNGAYRVRIYIDALTELPSATEATIALRHAVSQEISWNGWGDVVERTEYLNWDLHDGVRFPQQWDMFRNGALFRTMTYADVRFDTSPGEEHFAMQTPPDGALPGYADELHLGQRVTYAPDPKRPVEEIAQGIVQIPNSWYTTLVRQDDGIVIIDAPISAGYSAQVLAEAARRFPGVPIKAVITSTGFYWHIAGVREYAARGIPIYVRDRNAPIVRDILASPHTIAPDALAREPRPADIRPVSTRTVIGSGRHAIVLIPIRYGEQPMVMTWIADAKLLHTAEMVQPLGPNGSLLFPEALQELTQSVRDAGIDTHGLRMIGMHMSPTPWTTLEETLHAAGG